VDAGKFAVEEPDVVRVVAADGEDTTLQDGEYLTFPLASDH
jgi:hypothetical protein